MPEKKSRILYIKKYLMEHTDEAHPATMSDILSYLSDVGISAHQRTVISDIEQLIESGVDIVINRSRHNQYFIGDGHFEMPELKLLIDAAQASRFLSAKRSRALINKLLSLTSRHNAESLKCGLPAGEYVKPTNENAYIAANILLTAINEKKLVHFMYHEYTPMKKKVYKHGRRVYELSPWHLAWDSDKYYVIGYSKHHSKGIKFRVDRIASPKMTDLPAIPAPDDFNLAEYVKSVFQMYDGALLEVTLQCKNDFMKTIVDRFGEDVETSIADDEHFNAKVKVHASKTFYGWLFGMDGAVRIIAPDEAIITYSDMIKTAASITIKKD